MTSFTLNSSDTCSSDIKSVDKISSEMNSSDTNSLHTNSSNRTSPNLTPSKPQDAQSSSDIQKKTTRPLWKTVLHPSPSPRLTTRLTLLFAVLAAIASANLYYTHPLLNLIAASFEISYQRASLVPQLLQAGYGVGILLLCPLGDGTILPLRPFLLALSGITTASLLGLCLVTGPESFSVFLGLAFLVGFTAVGPQVLIPLVGDLAYMDFKPEEEVTCTDVTCTNLTRKGKADLTPKGDLSLKGDVTPKGEAVLAYTEANESHDDKAREREKDKKATAAVATVLAGMLMGLALPRVVAGVLTGYLAGQWRGVLWFALGVQAVLGMGGLWWGFPHFPVRPEGKSRARQGREVVDKSGFGGSPLGTRAGERRRERGGETIQQYGENQQQPDRKRQKPHVLAEAGRRYLQILSSIIKMALTEPMLAYGCVIAFLINAAQASFWTTLTAHLASPPFNFGPLQIGLFSIIAIVTTMMIPLYSWAIVERFETWFASILGMSFGIILIIVDAFAGTTTKIGVVGPLLQSAGLDFGLQAASVAYRAGIYRKLPANRANVAFTGSAFIGQLVGTSVGNAIYAKRGWMELSTVHLGVGVLSAGLVLLRGPGEARWVGWRGGLHIRLKDQKRAEARGAV